MKRKSAGTWKRIALVLLCVVFPPILIGYVAFKIYEASYYRSDKFRALKERVAPVVADCNALNAHIEGLKKAQVGFDQLGYGEAVATKRGGRGRKREQAVERDGAANVHNCSRAVCSSAADQPVKYVCKYFDIDATEEYLEKFEAALNDFVAVEEGVAALKRREQAVLDSISGDVPDMVRRHSRKLGAKLGFDEVDDGDGHYPVYRFKYVSPGGNSTLETTVVMDLANLDEMVNYLNGKVGRKKEDEGKRGLLNRALRKKVVERDGHICRSCGASATDEPNLLLEVVPVTPVAEGGTTCEDNLTTVCWRCKDKRQADGHEADGKKAE